MLIRAKQHIQVIFLPQLITIAGFIILVNGLVFQNNVVYILLLWSKNINNSFDLFINILY